MTLGRRRVRVDESFLGQLDELLPADRGPNGEPSVTDFLVIDLPAVVDRFATDFASLPEIIDGLPSARMLISTGRLVSRFVVYGVESPEGGIDLIGIDLEVSRLSNSGLCRVKARDTAARTPGFRGFTRSTIHPT